MKRDFDFTEDVKRKAFFRQWNLCAHCGKSLINEYDHAHHVLPNQAGDLKNPNDAFIKSFDNCVILCDMCHYRVHEDGRYRTGATALPRYFPFSHGREAHEHQIWLSRIQQYF